MGITHTTAATGTDSGDGRISKNAWNEDHTVDTGLILPDQGSTPSTPASGHTTVFTKSDGLYVVDDAGAETGPLVDSNSGTSFPTAATGDRYWRSDLGQEFWYDGTRWRSTTTYMISATAPDFTTGSTIQPTSANNALARCAISGGAFAVYVMSFWAGTYVVTTNNGSNYWTFGLTANPSSTALGSVSTAADSADTHTPHAATINAVVAATDADMVIVSTKTGSPGNCYWGFNITFQRIAT
jgi:hypothetical protein